MRPLNSPNTVSGIGSYDQLIQQYQQHQNQSQFRLQQMSAVSQPFRDQGMKSMQAAQSAPDPFGLLGLLSVIRMSDPDLTSLALGIDLTTLGLNLNSTENLHKTFGSPWSDEPAKGDPEFSVPLCYYSKQPPPLHVSCIPPPPFLIIYYFCKIIWCFPSFSLFLLHFGGGSMDTSQNSRWKHCFIYFTGAFLY